MNSFYGLTPAQQAERYERLAREALAYWQLQDAGLRLLKMRENAVFEIQTPEGRRHVIRIHRAGYHSDAELRSELQWMSALAVGGVEVPQLIPTPAGEDFIVLERDYIGEPRQIDVFDWIEGRQLGSVEDGLAGDRDTLCNNFSMIGALAARVHNISAAWDIPAGFTRHAWDTQGLVGESPFWGRFWELPTLTAGERDLMLRARERIRRDLGEYGQSADTYGIIHADIVPENVLVDGEQLRLIDFDDAGFGWHLFEIATSLYFSKGIEHFDALKAALLTGYQSVRPLSQRDLDFLPLFMLARGTTYLGWVHTRRETETARELTPMLVESVCDIAEAYINNYS